MAQPRIAALDYSVMEGDAKQVVDATLVGFDRPMNIFLTLARRPDLLKAITRLGHRFLFAGRLDPRLREIAILRVAWRTECEYEFAQHTVIGAKAGLSTSEMAALASPAAAGRCEWTTAEVVTIQAVDDLYFRDVLSESVWASLTEELSESDILELILLVGYYRMLAGFLNTANVSLEAGLPSWPETLPSDPSS